MDLRKSSITADILNVLHDGKVHTMQEIAQKVEVHINTVQRHIQSLSYRYPIETFRGGDIKGGVKLDTKYMVQGKILTNEKLQILGKALALLQESNANEVNQDVLKELIRDFTPPTQVGGQNENQQKQIS